MVPMPLRRAYHRLDSGLSFGREEVRLLTLTSSPESPSDILHSFEVLRNRLKRMGLHLQYFVVKEYTGLTGMQHIHVLYRGGFLERQLIIKHWTDIHRAYIVDIRKTYGKRRKIGNYLVKYLVKGIGADESTTLANFTDFAYLPATAIPDKPRKLWSCSRDWCYRRFTKVWQSAVNIWHRAGEMLDITLVCRLWELHLGGDSTPAAFLRWLSDIGGLDPNHRQILASIHGNEGFFATRLYLGYEGVKA